MKNVIAKILDILQLEHFTTNLECYTCGYISQLYIEVNRGSD